MPVIVEYFPQYDPQLEEDLDKIYSDEPYCLNITKAPAQRIKSLLEKGQYTLFGARFNGKLIGAAILEERSLDEFALHHFCIRSITRRRGAGKQFIKGIISNTVFKTGGKLLCRVHSSNTAGIALINQAGFTPCPASTQSFSDPTMEEINTDEAHPNTPSDTSLYSILLAQN